MRIHLLPPLAVIAAIAVLGGCGGGDSTSEGGSGANRFDGARAFADLKAQVRLGPRPSGSVGARRQVELIKHRLRATGVEDVRVQSPLRNVVATIPGREPGTVILGAHWDTKDIPGFLGANDGASGVAVLLELARSLPRRLDGPSVQLVFFDGEEARGDREFTEDGTRGSRQYVRDARASTSERPVQGAPPLSSIKSMILFDMIGDCDLRIPREAFSDKRLYDAFAAASERVSGSPEPFTGISAGVLDDTTPFVQADVASVDLIDFDYGPGASPGAYWHTREDTPEHVCARSLDRVGEATIAALPEIGGP